MYQTHKSHRQSEISEGRNALQLLQENYGSLQTANISLTITPRPGKSVNIDLPALISSKLATPLAWAIAEVIKELETEANVKDGSFQRCLSSNFKLSI